MLKRIMVVVVAAVTVTATSGVALAAPGLTIQKIAAMSREEQAAILDPLRKVANAAGTVGRGQATDLLAGIQIDATTNTVSIYLTDLKQQNIFQEAMRQVDKSADLGLARFRAGRYAIAQLSAVAQKLIVQKRPGLSIESVALAPDGNSLQVRAYNLTQTRSTLTAMSDVGRVDPDHL